MSSMVATKLQVKIVSNLGSEHVDAYIDSKTEASFLRASIAGQLSTLIWPIPQARQRSVMLSGVGLIEPKKWVEITIDIPELGVFGEVVNVQLAEWDTSLPIMFLGQRLMGKLTAQTWPVMAKANDSSVPTAPGIGITSQVIQSHHLPSHILVGKITTISPPEQSCSSEAGTNASVKDYPTLKTPAKAT
ncbi:hypothetical protein QC764_0068670 [Podospora pseudoanserina]|uniref:Peptidase A2 domain-containing protein n=1 Tax=Podospora pseudoanserina TaxID=2609844 RepID=A0ABR0IAJ4_9PEZI|nr:hypothetical protein QC764_0068670 [Podospora pseudoanserina]